MENLANTLAGLKTADSERFIPPFMMNVVILNWANSSKVGNPNVAGGEVSNRDCYGKYTNHFRVIKPFVCDDQTLQPCLWFWQAPLSPTPTPGHWNWGQLTPLLGRTSCRGPPCRSWRASSPPPERGRQHRDACRTLSTPCCPRQRWSACCCSEFSPPSGENLRVRFTYTRTNWWFPTSDKFKP